MAKLAEVVGEAGKASVTVEVELWAEELLSGKRQLCTRGQFVLIAVDKAGKPTVIRTA